MQNRESDDAVARSALSVRRLFYFIFFLQAKEISRKPEKDARNGNKYVSWNKKYRGKTKLREETNWQESKHAVQIMLS